VKEQGRGASELEARSFEKSRLVYPERRTFYKKTGEKNTGKWVPGARRKEQ